LFVCPWAVSNDHSTIYHSICTHCLGAVH